MVTLLAIIVWPLLFVYIIRVSGLSPYLAWLVSGSIITFVVYGLDKGAAKLNTWRVSERTLHLMSLLGGFGGAALGLIFWQHKFRKGTFVVVILVSALIHFGLVSALASTRGW